MSLASLSARHPDTSRAASPPACSAWSQPWASRTCWRPTTGAAPPRSVRVESANQFSSLGFGQFIVVNPTLPAHLRVPGGWRRPGFGIGALILVTALAGPLAGPFEVPNLTHYVPGMALSLC